MNSFGRKFRVSIFGESHGPAIGVVLDGVPSGLALSVIDFIEDIDRRRTGAFGTSPRRESDEPIILTGLYDGKTTGAPLTIIFKNENVRSGDYSAFSDIPRPGHADYTASVKWDSYNDPRGGGHFSGRLTLPIVAAGVVAKKMFPNSIHASIVELGGLKNPQQWEKRLKEVASEGDSLGAVVECRATMPEGIGEPFWDGVESVVSHAIFSIPGVRGIEFGDGFKAATMLGSEHNDPFGPDGKPSKNGSGGINGGIANGAELLFRVAFKPTSSISKLQKTYDFSKDRMTDFKVGGRHDVCFALRTPVIVEAMTAIVLADLVI